MIEVDSGSFFFSGIWLRFLKKGVLVGDGAPHDYSEHYEQNP